MLRLEKVSKFYSANGVVTSGFSKVSLNFEIGEFVAITGESGSGKSTLLNVMSGLDSYEEGEMYIFDKPTSGYGGDEMEIYRKKYIGNIFQTFNLISHYTVYQNIELVLLLAGYKRSEVKERVDGIIKKVGLERYRNTKTSKLSGGQKQRVAIARALAKETPIIVADEPTGNLDVESAAEIIKLLASLSKEKLILIVTHNYEQVEPYVTRKITMRDGRVAEDKRLKEAETVAQNGDDQEVKEAKTDGLSAGNAIRLGVRNSFSLPAKFLLLLIVFLFICLGTAMAYSSSKNLETDDGYRYNSTFNDTNPKRIVVTKPDKSAFTEEDYTKLASIKNIESIVREDLFLDLRFTITNMLPSERVEDEQELWLTGKPGSMNDIKGELINGKLPEAPGEVLLLLDTEQDYYIDALKTFVGKELYICDQEQGFEIGEGAEQKVIISGCAAMTEEQAAERRESFSNYYEAIICGPAETEKLLRASVMAGYVTQEAKVNDVRIAIGNGALPVMAHENLKKGEVYIPEEMAQYYDYGNWWGKTIDIKTKGLFFTNEHKFNVAYAYSAMNCEWLLGKKAEDLNGGIYMNADDIKSLYASDNYQSSVMMNQIHYSNETVKAIQDAGYTALRVHDGQNSIDETVKAIIKSVRMALLAVMISVMFFVSYFIIKLIFKSQNVYYSTVRMLGGSRNNCSSVLIIEMLIVFNIAFGLVSAFLLKVKDGTISQFKYLNDMVLFFEKKEFLILYVIILIMTLLLAARYSSQMFKKTAMNSYKEEV